MTKAEIIDAAAGSAVDTEAVAALSTIVLVASVTAEVGRGIAFGRSGLGTIDAEHPKVRTGRTQRTGETVKIAATTRMVCSAGATLTAA